ncbi:mechanosensitive ion channel family protein [Stakelama saccharophila]|uniref:Mechanosensitive ion channel family protein n=1 Tax=Stakelama saccharophila TaxID=3075605 RepID=A0ABZ0BAG6_9SPHN|nr:mechanosensitive ion channel family protein [Stakelama sp. W311]WNO53304.1 mechanosensitive ion channel family protein [Stakelama sp. W311]
MNSNAAAAAATNEARIDTAGFHEQAEYLFRSSWQWIDHHWLQIAIAVVVAAVIFVVLQGVKRWGAKLGSRKPDSTGWRHIIGRAFAKTTNFFILMTAIKLVVGYSYAPLLVQTTVIFLFTVAAVFQAAVWAREIILGFITHRTESGGHGEALGSAMGIIRLLVSFLVFAVALIVVFDNLGVDVTGLVAGLGVGGIAIGLAAQGIFADLFAALSIIFDRPFRKGDSVAYDDTFASIEQIGLKSTRLRAFSGEELIISNRNLLDKQITNNTHRIHRRGTFMIGVTYQTPPEVCAKIPAMMQEIVERHDCTFSRCGFVGFGASSLDFELVFDSEGPDFAIFYERRSAIGIAILRKFNDDGIDIAYPTQMTFAAGPDGKPVDPGVPEPAKGTVMRGA